MRIKFLMIMLASILALENLYAMDSSKRKEIISYSSRRKKQKIEPSVQHVSLFERCPLDVQRFIIVEKLASFPSDGEILSYAEAEKNRAATLENLRAIRKM